MYLVPFNVYIAFKREDGSSITSWAAPVMLTEEEAHQLRQTCVQLEIEGKIGSEWHVDRPVSSQYLLKDVTGFIERNLKAE